MDKALKPSSRKIPDVKRSFMIETFEAAGLKPWQKYMTYVRRAYETGAPGVEELLKVYDALSRNERDTKTPEELCEMSGVPQKILFGTIAGQLWEVGYQTADMMLAIQHPKIVARSIKEALKTSGQKDRESLLKANGVIPIPKNNSIHFHKHVSGGAAARGDSDAPPPAVLPSFEDDLSQLEDDDLPRLPAGS